jgi:hypothetical protein
MRGELTAPGRFVLISRLPNVACLSENTVIRLRFGRQSKLWSCNRGWMPFDLRVLVCDRCVALLPFLHTVTGLTCGLCQEIDLQRRNRLGFYSEIVRLKSSVDCVLADITQKEDAIHASIQERDKLKAQIADVR